MLDLAAAATLLRLGLYGLLCLEMCWFVLCVWFVRPFMQRPAKPVAARPSPEAAIEKVLDACDLVGEPFTRFLEGWFRGEVSVDDMDEAMVVEFLAWAMYSADPRALHDEQRATCARVLASVRARYGSELFPPRAPQTPGRVAVRAMRLTLDRVRLNHRPLALYCLSRALGGLGAAALVMRGFSYHANGPVAFWFRPAARGAEDESPLIFFHGVSASRLPYLPLFFSCLGERSGRAAAFVEIASVLMTGDLLAPARETPASVLAAVRDVLRMSSACSAAPPAAVLVGDSWGTIAVTWVIHRAPGLVRHAVLLNPVAVLLSFPSVAYNFVYRARHAPMPKTAEGPRAWYRWMFHLALDGAVTTEPTIAWLLRRHFWWHQNCLYLDEIPESADGAPSALVAVSDEDELLDADLISRYVRAHSERRPRHVDLVRWRAFKHYYIAFSPRAQAEVAAWIRAADKRHTVSR